MPNFRVFQSSSKISKLISNPDITGNSLLLSHLLALTNMVLMSNNHITRLTFSQYITILLQYITIYTIYNTEIVISYGNFFQENTHNDHCHNIAQIVYPYNMFFRPGVSSTEVVFYHLKCQ